MQEKYENQFKEIRKSIQDINENFIKETDILKQKIKQILELKNSLYEIQMFEAFNNRPDQAEERISEYKDRSFEKSSQTNLKKKSLKKINRAFKTFGTT